MKIGILTGGGDAPGLNSIIEASGRSLINRGHQVFGIRNAFEGIFNREIKELTLETLVGLHTMPGTTLGASNKSRVDGRETEFLESYNWLGLDAILVAGGDGTFRALKNLLNEINIVGVPKTIDNDLRGTDATFGYDTACSVVSQALDALKHTAAAHGRVFLVETMGRTAGWIALGSGLASYVDAILIPERPFDQVALKSYILKRKQEGRNYLIMAIAEGAYPVGEAPQVAFRVPGSPQEERFGGISERMARWINDDIGWDARHVVLGHLQRSSPPTTTDRFFTMGMGVVAADLINQKKWGRAVVYRSGRIIDTELMDLCGEPRIVNDAHPWLGYVRDLDIFI